MNLNICMYPNQTFCKLPQQNCSVFFTILVRLHAVKSGRELATATLATYLPDLPYLLYLPHLPYLPSLTTLPTLPTLPTFPTFQICLKHIRLLPVPERIDERRVV
jgi:hypothetical protein